MRPHDTGDAEPVRPPAARLSIYAESDPENDRIYYEHHRKPPVSCISCHLPEARHLSGCGRCGHRWNHVEPHKTHTGGGAGCFPLCEKCWAALTPETRLPYYRDLHDMNVAQGMPDERWEATAAAVLSGG